MAKFRKPFFFALCLLPFAIAAGIFAGFYQLDIYSDEVIAEMTAQFGSTDILIVIGAVQTVIYALFCGFFGYILADKTGLWKTIKPKKKSLVATFIVSLIGGIVFSLDYPIFGSLIEPVKASYAAGITANNIIASVLYGDIIEEVMLRLFFMSLIAFVLWKVFCKNRSKEKIPTAVFIAANLIAALAFAAGHLPATLSGFGELTPLIVFRCFLLNGGFGLVLGRLYRKYGIIYAMISHALFHIIGKLILLVVI